MADQPTSPSGSRWEPDGPDGAPTAETPRAAEPAAAPSYPAAGVGDSDTDAAVALDEQVADERRAQLRGRAVLAGAATALALGAGVAGFVIGHSTAGNDTNGFRPAGFTGQQGGQLGGQLGGQTGQPGQLGEGQQPPGFGHDGDRGHDGDGDHGFGQPPQGSTGGGSSSGSSGSGAGTTGNPT